MFTNEILVSYYLPVRTQRLHISTKMLIFASEIKKIKT